MVERLINVDIEVELSPAELAEMFWSLGSYDQAEFFNELGKYIRLPQQLQYVSDSPCLTSDGKWAMCRIGEYGA